MTDSEQIGLMAEVAVEKLLRKKFPKLNICWTRRERRNNAPFDFELYDRVHCVGLIEVKGFGIGRKWYWTQYKRPQIKRKLRRAKELKDWHKEMPPMATIVVKIHDEERIGMRWEFGFPSQPFTDFNESFTKLWQEIKKRVCL